MFCFFSTSRKVPSVGFSALIFQRLIWQTQELWVIVLHSQVVSNCHHDRLSQFYSLLLRQGVLKVLADKDQVPLAEKWDSDAGLAVKYQEHRAENCISLCAWETSVPNLCLSVLRQSVPEYLQLKFTKKS